MEHTTFRSSVVSQEEYQAENAWGLLASLNLYGCETAKITDLNVIRDFLQKLCAAIDMKPHGEPLMGQFGEGSLEGYSALQFIETSSITVHFDDKGDNRAFIDIFSCKYFDAEKARVFCHDYLNASRSEAHSLLRK
jgi:S-adenosylmethionine/arginine decarboxylase-like enzyme